MTWPGQCAVYDHTDQKWDSYIHIFIDFLQKSQLISLTCTYHEIRSIKSSNTFISICAHLRFHLDYNLLLGMSAISLGGFRAINGLINRRADQNGHWAPAMSVVPAQFFGTWVSEKDENFDEFLASKGVPWLARTVSFVWSFLHLLKASVSSVCRLRKRGVLFFKLLCELYRSFKKFVLFSGRYRRGTHNQIHRSWQREIRRRALGDLNYSQTVLFTAAASANYKDLSRLGCCVESVSLNPESFLILQIMGMKAQFEFRLGEEFLTTLLENVERKVG